MKQKVMFRIAMERCITGWHYDAIEEEKQHLQGKEVEQLCIIHRNLRAMRQAV